MNWFLFILLLFGVLFLHGMFYAVVPGVAIGLVVARWRGGRGAWRFVVAISFFVGVALAFALRFLGRWPFNHLFPSLDGPVMFWFGRSFTTCCR
jgi:hypothetical protein